MGRTAEMVLGIIGGIFGILGGLFAIFFGVLAAVVGEAGLEIIVLGTVAVILGVIGIIGGAVVNSYPKLAGSLMLFSGLVGIIAVSARMLLKVGGAWMLKLLTDWTTLNPFFLIVVGAWIIGGILLIVGGVLSFLRSPEKRMNKKKRVSVPL